ncbi:hypothetical protein EJ08DRAFT_498568 [Tothia fuscella]|uniref:Uncharacterized protein n=1 Tax=Tothia fuscella TaxID=1048955 RepID=A0A9P4NZ14_9PEZI|nr:hypothetical protein EJ08DRAFT_498568 [Tothia fuscella]
MVTMIQRALEKFDSADRDYDKLFGYFAQGFRSYMQQRLDEFMDSRGGKGLKYFTCVERTHTAKCDSEVFEPNAMVDWTMTYRIDDKPGFFRELADVTGIQEEWVNLKGSKSETVDAGGGTGDHPHPAHHVWLDRPMMMGKFQVPNPKEVIKAALPGAKALQARIEATLMEFKIGLWTFGHEDSLRCSRYRLSYFLKVLKTWRK